MTALRRREPRLPKRMEHLERDHRGYPIPVMVFRDQAGRPHFTINNLERTAEVIHQDQCGICGRVLLKIRWFVGGPKSAFDEHGAYADPPMHRDCMHYALQVCPYLAIPSYAGRIDSKTLDPADKKNRLFIDMTQDPARPVVFVGVAAESARFSQGYLKPTRPYRAAEFWQNGKQLSFETGMKLCADAHGANFAREARSLVLA